MRVAHLLRAGACALLVLIGVSAAAQPAPGVTELTVSGPPGARLLVDGQPLGVLPLADSVSLPAGGHRFLIERGSRRAESDLLLLPPNRQASLSLTLAGRNLVVVLTITPGVLLRLEPPELPAALRSALVQALARTVRQQHAVLLDGARAAVGDPAAAAAAISSCLERGDCHEPLSPEGEVSYVLAVRLPSDAGAARGAYRIQAALLDTRTRELGARGEVLCEPCDDGGLSEQLGKLTGRLLAETLSRPRGTLSVRSEPPGARILVAGRWLGVTPYQQEAFTGPRTVELQREGYVPQQQEVEIEAGKTTELQVSLQRTPSAPVERRARPRWRLATGGALLGGGLLLAGFGASALAMNGRCWDGSDHLDSCTPFYNTLAVGSGLVGSGSALAVAGVILLALPPPAARAP